MASRGDSIEDIRATWTGEVPAFGSTSEFYQFLVRYAVLAPSTMNTQPWLFRADEQALDIRPDLSRQLPTMDPQGREMIISCGAAAANAEVAARFLGYGLRIEFSGHPHPSFHPLARLHHRTSRPVEEADHLLFKAIRQRHTVRRPFEPRGIAAGLTRKIMDQAEREGVTVTTADDGAVRLELARLAFDMMEKLSGDTLRAQEAARWRAGWNDSRRDGVPQTVLTLAPHEYLCLYLFGGYRAVSRQARSLISQRMVLYPRLLVFSTPDDRPLNWLLTGYAMQYALLRAATYGIQACFLGALISTPEARQRTQTLLDLPTLPQLVLGLGHTTSRPATLRRPVEEVLLET